ncbi:unnamed protein product [Amaranthus hypochondriacus]
MAWVTSFHNAFASSLISLLANKLTELACTEIGYFWNVNDNLMSLVTLSRIVHMKLYKLGDKELPREWKPWVQEVTRLFYDVDDIIDGIILDVRKKNHLNQQQLANGQDQECSSSMWSSVLGNFGGRRRSGWQKAVPENEKQARKIILSSLKKWGLPHKINSLLEKLKEMEKQVDGLLQGVSQNQTSSAAESSQMGSIRMAIPRSSGLLWRSLGRAREKDKKIIIEKYLLNSSFRERGVCIVGMSGLGKTTLAQSIQNDERIKKIFAVTWGSVPGDFNSTANLIIEPSLQTQVVNGYPLDHRHGRKTLVVLDDVWNVHHGAWNNFVSTLVPGTILLITTRDPKVASITATIAYPINRLSNEDCSELMMKQGFRKDLFDDFDQYRPKVDELASKCGGLPLVATLVSLAMAAECREKGPEATFTALEQSDLWDLTVFRNEIFPALRFDDPCMPTEMGKFLGYLPLFPCDYFFKKDELLQLWMAEGFVTPEKWSPSKLKDAGQHFDHLLSRSILSSSKNCKDKIDYYKIHEFTHRYAQNIASNMCYQMNDHGKDRPFLPMVPIRHLSLCCQNIDVSHLEVIEKFYSRLRTFLLLPKQTANISEVPESLFDKLHFLRVVSLSRSHIATLPRSVGKLKHLRYLDLSYTPIQSLPDTICNLLGLLIIKLKHCPNLLHLPKKISNLVNLILLDMDMACLPSIPPSIGKLTNLQSLDIFTVKDEEGYRITELRDMNSLQGSLKIMKLENIVNVREAEDAKLSLKAHLYRLELHWSHTHKSIPLVSANGILNMLQPNNNLTELGLVNYSAYTFSSWLTSPSCHLKVIYLYKCPYIQELPEFWKLPSLRTLNIDAASSVQQMGRNFFGDLKCSRFPMLIRLELQNMERLTRWEELDLGDMPRLRDLKFINCPVFSTLPTLRFLTALENLDIVHCPEWIDEPELPLSLKSYNWHP